MKYALELFHIWSDR